MTPDRKGAIAEAELAAAAISLGIDVLRPLNEGLRYDLVFDLRPRLLRVQCKWAVRRGDVVVVSCRTSRRGHNGFIRGSYSAEEVDAIGVYCAELDRSYLIPIERVAASPFITLRFAPTKNNQQRRVNWARDFDFAATLRRLAGP